MPGGQLHRAMPRDIGVPPNRRHLQKSDYYNSRQRSMLRPAEDEQSRPSMPAPYLVLSGHTSKTLSKSLLRATLRIWSWAFAGLHTTARRAIPEVARRPGRGPLARRSLVQEALAASPTAVHLRLWAKTDQSALKRRSLLGRQPALGTRSSQGHSYGPGGWA